MNTPLPWFEMGIDDVGRVLISGSPFTKDHPDPLHHVKVAGSNLEEAKDNAALIVKAVNNHDKLVEALRGMMNVYAAPDANAAECDGPVTAAARALLAELEQK